MSLSKTYDIDATVFYSAGAFSHYLLVLNYPLIIMGV